MTAIHPRLHLSVTSSQLITLPAIFDDELTADFESITNHLFTSGVQLVIVDARNVQHLTFEGQRAILNASDRAFSTDVRFVVLFNPPAEPQWSTIPSGTVLSAAPCELDLVA